MNQNGPEPLLSVRDVSVRLGSTEVLQHVDLRVQRRVLVALIGPNGAGKTTLFNVIGGIHRPYTGQVWLDGREITHAPPGQIAAAGVARTFQNAGLFGSMTVADNVAVGQSRIGGPNVFAQSVCWGSVRFKAARRVEVAWILDFLGLKAVAGRAARSLSTGLQKLVELGRGLAAGPRLLLLDEPLATLSPDEKQRMTRAIVATRRHVGCAIVLIVHDIAVVSELADRVLVLEYGRRIAEGTPEEIRANPRVIEAYLGMKGRSRDAVLR